MLVALHPPLALDLELPRALDSSGQKRPTGLWGCRGPGFPREERGQCLSDAMCLSKPDSKPPFA